MGVRNKFKCSLNFMAAHCFLIFRYSEIIFWGLGPGCLEWSLFRYILICYGLKKGVCYLTVNALREKGSKYVIA